MLAEHRAGDAVIPSGNFRAGHAACFPHLSRGEEDDARMDTTT